MSGVWWLFPGGRLSTTERDALDRLAAHEPPGAQAPISLAASPETVRLLPLDVNVVLGLERLPARFHGDPADPVIVARARVHGLRLASRDRHIRRSRVVPIWNP
jgi:PIN domain nuclease of toxin-antitoxin system